MTLGAYICVRNGDVGDYCWREAAASLLPVVDELILCDSDSTDGTREAMDRWADTEPKIRVINYPWPKPKGDAKWWTTWLNFAREHLTTDLQITLDGDEILSDHPDCHQAIREANANGKPRTFNRLNFWRDAAHLIPEGHCCGKKVTRFGLAKYWMPSDEGHPAGELPILDQTVYDHRLEIFHLGFLRRKDAFYRKARVVLGAFFNEFDKRLEPLEKAGKHVSEVGDCEWTNGLVPWEGYMPDAAQRWLSERGHNTEHYLGMNEQEAYRRVQVTTEMPKRGEPMNVLHVGDLGDILHCLPILKAIGNVNLYVRDANHICKRIIHRIPLIEPLLRKQSYIKEFAEHTDQPIHWNAGDFRKEHELTHSLYWAHLRHYGGHRHFYPTSVNHQSPWLTGITPDPAGAGRIIINRTDRYNNRHFRWKEIVAHYGRALLFVGHPEEHLAFSEAFGPVDYQRTENLLEVAQLIAASLLFIGNQSACFAVAEGMKHLRLLEVCPWQPDVIVDAPGGSAIYSADGSLDIPELGRLPALKCATAITHVNYLKNPNHQPRTGWKLNGYWDISYSTLKRQVMAKTRMTDKEAHKAIFDALAEREPEYFGAGEQRAEMKMFEQAIANTKQS